MSAASYGIDYCWGGYRLKQQAHNLFAAGDGRASYFFTTGQQVNVDTIGQFSNGIAAPKFTNKKSSGAHGAQSRMVDKDFPIFPLAYAYLIYAEASLRGGGGTPAQAEAYVNSLRVRAFGRSEEHTSELQSLAYLVCRLLLEKKKKTNNTVPVDCAQTATVPTTR